jgi:hypothetical protein
MVTAANAIPSTIRKLFGKPPIMAGESAEDYWELVALVRADVKPQELQEWLLVKDIADAEGQLLRLRGLKVGMLNAGIPGAVVSEITAAGDPPAAEMATLLPLIRKHVIGVVAGDQQAHRALADLLQAHNLTLDAINAVAFQRNLMPQLHTDRMVGAAYDRRNAAYAELAALRTRKEKLARRPWALGADDVDADIDDDRIAPTAPGAAVEPQSSPGPSDVPARQH